MSILDWRLRRATSQRTRMVATMAAVVIPVLVLAACSDASLPVTAPPRPPADLSPTSYAPGEKPPNVLAGLVFCDVAFSAPSGNYRVRTVPIKVSPGLFDPKGKTVKVGFRGWVKGVSDPGSLALCQIPATAAATDFFKKVFSVDSVASPKGPRVAASRAGAPAPSSAVDDGITIYETQALSCETQILPDESCEPAPEEPTDEGPPPVQEEPADVSMGDGGAAYYYDDSSGAYAVAAIFCTGRTDWPHLSGTPGYFGNVNVHASTTCNIPTSITVNTMLSRQKCFWWVFCWWANVGNPGANARVGTFVDTNSASVGCSRGWYKGSSYHTAVYPQGLATARTANYNYIYC